MPIIKRFFFLHLILFILCGCDLGKTTQGTSDMKSIQTVSEEKWKELVTKKIYFGHQSVGYNIIDGMKAVMADHSQIKLHILETRDPVDNPLAGFFHSRVGKNEDPQSKTDDFAQIMESGIGNKANIAFHKYCYIDFHSGSDVDKVFAHYQEKMNYLKSHFPETTFVHITVPLTTIQTGPKAWIKKILGKPVAGVDANIKRHNFNQLLVKTFQGQEPLFDLAKTEATRPDGTASIFRKNGNEYLSMYKGYTNDGGHLNGLGQKIVAEQLLIFLVDNLDRENPTTK